MFSNWQGTPIGTNIRRLHALIGNFNTTGKSLVIFTGATQGIQATFNAISFFYGKKWVYSTPPYYGSYVSWAENNPESALGFTTNTSLNGSDVIEIVTWPGNPAGRYSSPAYQDSIKIYDCVYYWPSTWGPNANSSEHSSTPPQGMLDEDIVAFSASKLTGHEGSRLGWIWFRDPLLAFAAEYALANRSVGMSIDSAYRLSKIFGKLSEQEVDKSDWFWDYTTNAIGERYSNLSALFATYSSSNITLQSPGYTWYLWVRCSTNLGVGCHDYFLSHGLMGRPGTSFGAEDDFVRFNFNLQQPLFDLLYAKIETALSSATQRTVNFHVG